MLEIAEQYIKKIEELGDIELMLFPEIIKKSYGNIYFFNSKEYLLTGDIAKAVGGNAPFLVEKEKQRVVSFGTSNSLESYIEDYEFGELTPSLDRYWYPDEDRFSHK